VPGKEGDTFERIERVDADRTIGAQREQSTARLVLEGEFRRLKEMRDRHDVVAERSETRARAGKRTNVRTETLKARTADPRL
jgi:hypothetical protein